MLLTNHITPSMSVGLTIGGIILLIRFIGWLATPEKNEKPSPRHAAPHPPQPVIDPKLKQLIEKYGAEAGRKIYRKEVFDGMTPEQLIEIAGEPTDIQADEHLGKAKISYIYGKRSTGQIFVFMNNSLNMMIYKNIVYA